MDRPISHAFKRAHRWTLVLAVTAFAVTGAIALGVGSAGAARVTVLGSARSEATSCTPDLCIVEAKVTGFQTRIGSIRKPFSVPAAGKIVAWSIKLGKPSKASLKGTDKNGKHTPGLNELFGVARARLAVLGRNKKKKNSWKLKAQSPVEDLAPFFGSTMTFVLDRPLKVGRGQQIGLTIPTWAPAFRLNSSGSTWQASRKPGKRGGCLTRTDDANLAAGSPVQAIGKIRAFSCSYENRLLYSASLVRKGNG
ncbi:MAG: hypothetical protein EXQ70_00415 [Solirubrobacterales bacterium]|nr:hypothetical protein [Solirubrobacterales bacterium]